ncbi:hypothetical protein P7D85_08390 [Enterococcus hulanensis]|uniref:Uncharacterized protein n=1 Tax=Enterococcus hulanensis TaxID=2559929 RepID=A0ABU3EY34_9ENTE|nr:hypothetical protein [Enterococcus hulanensis]MDT2599789.1 hypothetical protein [Enterococcus hulanensis]MDT2609355.1 hypothetical protein [Enterococcus hulanensis]MDT2615932.1 hypothetical protein [Enterococcus hulanensis]MDT2628028.1 hypothetical protein [Enterococcus hulanensis]MDT2655133.1 hypothetical protein [Enterococcus hulanensis]
MAEYEKDFIMRQSKNLAKGLSQFLEQDSIDQILDVDQKHNKVNLDKFIENELERFKRDQEAIKKDCSESDE